LGEAHGEDEDDDDDDDDPVGINRRASTVRQAKLRGRIDRDNVA
jgi:hypothetical protein